MKVDSSLIRAERTRRGWSQEQLAESCGLGYRTIQRIEAEGDVSLASARALSAALGIDMVDLQVDGHDDPIPSRIQQTSKRVHLLLAALSGLLCAGLTLTDFDEGGFWFFALSGMLFGATVLLPVLQPGRFVLLRSSGILIASALSYYTAVTLAVSVVTLFWDRLPRMLSYSLASLAGVALVVLAARWLLPLHFSRVIFRLAAGSALLGAAVFAAVDVYGNDALVFLAYTLWHSLVCMTIRKGRLTSQGGSGDDLLDHILVSLRLWKQGTSPVGRLVRSLEPVWRALGPVAVWKVPM